MAWHGPACFEASHVALPRAGMLQRGLVNLFLWNSPAAPITDAGLALLSTVTGEGGGHCRDPLLLSQHPYTGKHPCHAMPCRRRHAYADTYTQPTPIMPRTAHARPQAWTRSVWRARTPSRTTAGACLRTPTAT